MIGLRADVCLPGLCGLALLCDGVQEDEGAVQGAVVGVIVPPPDKRVICDKTAEFVARNGPSFLKKIRATDPTGRKFSFLNGDDIYNAYFLKKIKDYQEAQGAICSPACLRPCGQLTATWRPDSHDGTGRGHPEAGSSTNRGSGQGRCAEGRRTNQ